MALTDKKPESKDATKDKSSSRKSEGMPLEGEKKEKRSEGHRDKHEHSKSKPASDAKPDTKHHHSKDKTEAKEKGSFTDHFVFILFLLSIYCIYFNDYVLT
jgi:hypothetical protein